MKIVLAWLAAGPVLAASAPANIITLSDLSSDGGVDPADLSATIEFTVTGNQLSITVTNLAAGYTLSEFLWNAPDDVTLYLALCAEHWPGVPELVALWRRRSGAVPA